MNVKTFAPCAVMHKLRDPWLNARITQRGSGLLVSLHKRYVSMKRPSGAAIAGGAMLQLLYVNNI